MAEADRELASWVRTHPYLTPVELEVGETGMALLILWEVDHGCSWPSQAEDDQRSSILAGFTRRLKRRVLADPVLSGWLRFEDAQRPLAFGLADTHNTRWSVQVRQPSAGEPLGWWDEFTLRWRSYLVTQQHLLPASSTPPGAVLSPVVELPASGSPATQLPASRRRPRSATRTSSPAVKRRVAPPSRPVAVSALSSCQATSPPTLPCRSRSASPPKDGPPRKRQATLAHWLTSRPLPAATAHEEQLPGQARHGRATEGPPT